MQVSNNNKTNFGAGYHVYFFTNDGKRIVSDQYMKKCIHYMEAHLNNSKRVKVRNQELVDNFRYGQMLPTGKRRGGDYDYWNIGRIRTVIDKTKDKVQGFINVVTGKDVDIVNERYGKDIGRSKRISKLRTGSTDSFETSYSVGKYINKAPDYAESKAVYKNGERQAFGICFTPIYKRNGELKSFEYHHSGFFDEKLVKQSPSM